MNDNNRPKIITNLKVFEVSLCATDEGPKFGIGGTCTLEDSPSEICAGTTNPPQTKR